MEGTSDGRAEREVGGREGGIYTYQEYHILLLQRALVSSELKKNISITFWQRIK